MSHFEPVTIGQQHLLVFGGSLRRNIVLERRGSVLAELKAYQDPFSMGSCVTDKFAENRRSFHRSVELSEQNVADTNSAS